MTEYAWIAGVTVAVVVVVLWRAYREAQRVKRLSDPPHRYERARCRRCLCGVLLYGYSTMSHLSHPPHARSEIEWSLRYGAVLERDETGQWREIVPAGAAAEGVPV